MKAFWLTVTLAVTMLGCTAIGTFIAHSVRGTAFPAWLTIPWILSTLILALMFIRSESKRDR